MISSDGSVPFCWVLCGCRVRHFVLFHLHHITSSGITQVSSVWTNCGFGSLFGEVTWTKRAGADAYVRTCTERTPTIFSQFDVAQARRIGPLNLEFNNHQQCSSFSLCCELDRFDCALHWLFSLAWNEDYYYEEGYYYNDDEASPITVTAYWLEAACGISFAHF